MPYGNLEVPLYIKSEQFGESIDINLENYIENDYQKQISKTTIDENTLIIFNIRAAPEDNIPMAVCFEVSCFYYF